MWKEQWQRVCLGKVHLLSAEKPSKNGSLSWILHFFFSWALKRSFLFPSTLPETGICCHEKKVHRGSMSSIFTLVALTCIHLYLFCIPRVLVCFSPVYTTGFGGFWLQLIAALSLSFRLLFFFFFSIWGTAYHRAHCPRRKSLQSQHEQGIGVCIHRDCIYSVWPWGG